MYTINASLLLKDTEANILYIIPIQMNDKRERSSIKIPESIYNYDYLVNLLNTGNNIIKRISEDSVYYDASFMIDKYIEVYLLNSEGRYKGINSSEVYASSKMEERRPFYLITMDDRILESTRSETNAKILARNIKEAYGRWICIYKGDKSILENYCEDDFELLLKDNLIESVEQL